MLPGILLFTTALLLSLALLYSAIEVVLDAAPERRIRKALQFGGIALVFMAFGIIDTPGALAALTLKAKTAETIGPVMRTLALTAFVVSMTMVYTRRSQRLNDTQIRSSQIVGTVMFLSIASILIGLLFAAASEYKILTPALTMPSVPAAWVGASAVFIISFAAVYSTIFSVINNLPLRWLSFAALVIYFVLFSADPPDLVDKALGGQGVSWIEAFRPYGLGLGLMLSIVPITMRSERAIIRDAVNAKVEENHRRRTS